MDTQLLPGLARGPRIDRTPLDTELEARLADLQHLPILPETAQRAMRLAEEGRVSLPEFARLIEGDLALAADILRLANSPLYSWGRSVDRLDQAVARLGLRECNNLIWALGVRGLGQYAQPGLRARCEQLWRHSFVVACLSRLLNREMGYAYRGEEFTAALLHDLGRVLLTLLVPETVAVADPLTFDEDGVLGRERELLGEDHCRVGARFADHIHLPDSLGAAIKHHHAPGRASAHRGLVGLVAAADHLANHIQRRLRPEAYDPGDSPGFVSLTRSWDEQQCAEFQKRLPAILRAAAAAFAESGLR